jgi:hypothetical protein
MKTDSFEILRLRNQFVLRGHTLNRRRRHPMGHWIALAVACIVPAIVCAILLRYI